MFGIEASYCNAMINALIRANLALLETTVEAATDKSHVVHKGDTLGIDQVPENIITSELTNFDQYAVLITEERGEEANPLARQTAMAIRGPRTFFVCDPCDRSSQLCEFLQNEGRNVQRVSEVLKKKNAQQKWEDSFGSPITITGANAAITCVRRGLPICSVLLNYNTQDITVACSAGIFHASVANYSTDVKVELEDIKQPTHLLFPNIDRERQRHFVTFMGKPERGYPQNFAMTKLAKEDDLKKQLHYDKPGGPTRILYLSGMQPREAAIGFILANGEKIGEWIHWLPFIRFSHREDDRGDKALMLFEVTQDESALRDGYLMTPTEHYSIFKDTEDRVVINVDRLGEFDNPSKYRGTLLVVQATNRWAIGHAQQFGYRPLIFYGD